MKKLILLFALLFSIAAIIPARADRDEYHDVKKKIGHLFDRFKTAQVRADRRGSSPLIRTNMHRAYNGLQIVQAQSDQRTESPSHISEECDVISDLLSQVEADFDQHLRAEREHYRESEHHRIIVNF